MTGVLKITLSSAWRRKRRLAGSTLAVLLGVAFLAGTLVFGDTARAGFADLFTEANAGIDVAVRSEHRAASDEAGVQQGLVDGALVDAVAAVDGVSVAEGVVEAVAQVLGSDGRPIGGEGPPTIAASWSEEPALNPFRVVDGRAPSKDDEVVIDRATVEEGGFDVGDTITVLTPAPLRVELVGIATFGDDDSMAGATFVGFTPAQAASLLPDPGAFTSVVAAAEPEVAQDELARRVAAVVPGDVEVLTGEQLGAEQEQAIDDDFLGFFETFLLVFAGVALLVAATSVHNTASILVAQRTREAALLRAVGASRSQVLGSTLLEAGLVGLAGSVAGAAAGIGLAAGLAALLRAGDVGLPIDGLTVSASSLAWAVGIGVVLSLLASLAPAVKASTVPPVAALQEVDTAPARVSRWRLLVGLTFVAVGAVSVLEAASSDTALATAGLGALGLFIGVVLLGPVVARPLARVLGAPLSLRGVTGRLARGGAERNPRRTAGTASALLVGVGVVVTFTVLAASLSSSIEAAVDRSFTGDFVVEGPDGGAGLDATVATELETLDEVEVAAALGAGSVGFNGDTDVDDFATVVDPARLARVADLDVQEGDLAAVEDGAIAVSAAFATDGAWVLGDVMPMAFADGREVGLRIDAIYDDSAMLGDVLLPSTTWAAHATQPTSFAVLVRLADGVDVEAGRAVIEDVTARYGNPAVQDQEEFVASQADQIESILTVIYGMLGIAIIIALLGIAGTLSLSIHERTREIGLLRAVGLNRRQLRSIVRGEAVVVSLLGTVGGLAVGTFVGWGLVRAGNAEEGGWQLAVPVTQLAVVVGLGALAGVLAAVRPARRAARLPILASLATT